MISITKNDQTDNNSGKRSKQNGVMFIDNREQFSAMLQLLRANDSALKDLYIRYPSALNRDLALELDDVVALVAALEKYLPKKLGFLEKPRRSGR